MDGVILISGQGQIRVVHQGTSRHLRKVLVDVGVDSVILGIVDCEKTCSYHRPMNEWTELLCLVNSQSESLGLRLQEGVRQ